jgi:Flp pilus assembly pilin Flp
MKEILRYMLTKLRAEKGEVSVEWVLVAVVMAIVIVVAFLPSVQTMLQAAINTISDKVTNAGTAT